MHQVQLTKLHVDGARPLIRCTTYDLIMCSHKVPEGNHNDIYLCMSYLSPKLNQMAKLDSPRPHRHKYMIERKAH